jgi:ADP-ribosylglycohydrolase
MNRKTQKHISGCLLGGAIGDALGAPIEFMDLTQIRRNFGPGGVTDYPELNAFGLAEFTDDTQMTLFTVEGLLIAQRIGDNADTTGPVHSAYLRWLQTQQLHYQETRSNFDQEGWLLDYPQLWKIKAPGNTCLSALRSGKIGTSQKPLNHSKGCGGVMRAAPVGYFFSAAEAFAEGVKAAAITHGHPSGYLSAGCLAQIIAEIAACDPAQGTAKSTLINAVQASLHSLRQWSGHEETLHALQNVLSITANDANPSASETIESLGGGWVGEEALAISLYSALIHPENFQSALLLSVNHSGDSDSTGAICGNILGALNGLSSIPDSWLQRIELGQEIIHLAESILAAN